MTGKLFSMCFKHFTNGLWVKFLWFIIIGHFIDLMALYNNTQYNTARHRKYNRWPRQYWQKFASGTYNMTSVIHKFLTSETNVSYSSADRVSRSFVLLCEICYIECLINKYTGTHPWRWNKSVNLTLLRKTRTFLFWIPNYTESL